MNEVELKVVPIISIWLDERFRKDMGDITSLAYSVKTHGIIQPLAVNRTEGPSGEEYKLLAGGRRYAACTRAGIANIPVRIYPEQLDAYHSRIIELEENVQRKDLTYIEDVTLKKEIHELYEHIHGGKKVSTSQDAEGWSVRDTAKMLGKSHGGVIGDIKLAKAIEGFPDLEWDKCKNKSEASKMLEKFQNRILRADLIERAQGIMKKEDKKLSDAYIVGDFFEHAKQLPKKSFNLIEVDPPYGINLKEIKSNAEGLDVYNEVDGDEYELFLHNLISQCWELLSNDGWLIFWFAPDPWLETVYQTLIDVGFKTRRLTAMWIKPTGQTHKPDKYLANSCEQFFYASKGEAQINVDKRGRSNLFHFSPVPPAQKVHPTERPVELMKEILSTFVMEGSRVLVPFAGSGNTLIAANQLSMFPIGYDLGKEYRDSYVTRILGGK